MKFKIDFNNRNIEYQKSKEILDTLGSIEYHAGEESGYYRNIDTLEDLEALQKAVQDMTLDLDYWLFIDFEIPSIYFDNIG